MKTKAFVVPVVVWVIAILGGGAMVAVPSWRPPSWFKKDQVAAANTELQRAQADLARAKADAQAAQDALAKVQQAELAKKDAQIRYAQQMAAGATESLAKATPEPPVKLAIALLDRTNHGLAVAIGDLPLDKQAEIIKIVSDSLSGVQAKLDEANAALAAKDKELTVVTTERTALKAQIPVLQSQLVAKEAVVVQQTATVAEKTQLVVAVAEKLQAKEKEAGSLTAYAHNLGVTFIIVCVLFIIYLVVKDVVLPSLAAEFPANKIATGAYRLSQSLTSAHNVSISSPPP